jgi:hypothetical protein
MMRRLGLLGLIALVGSVAAVPAPPAFAQSASVQAQALFDSGRKLMAAGKLAEACVAFENSQKLDPAVTTLLNLADCREQNHQLATAWGAFVDANRMARTLNNQKLATVANNHARKLEPRLSKLSILVPADHQVAGLEIVRGTDTVNPAAWNNPLPIDGGTYTITARARGYTAWKTTRTIKPEADNAAVEIPKLVEAVAAAAETPAPAPVKPAAPVAAPPPVVAVVAPRPSDGPPDVQPRKPSQSLILPVALGVGALALGGAAIGFHVAGNHAYDDSLKADAAGMRPEADKLHRSANNRRYAAQGFGVAALACAGTAVYFYLTGRSTDRSEGVAVAPVASPQLAGLAVVGSW